MPNYIINLYILYVIFGFAPLPLGIYALMKNYNEPLNRSFFLLCLSMTLTGLAAVLYRSSYNFIDAPLWDAFYDITFYSVMGFWVLVCIFFRDRKGFTNPLSYLLIYGPFFLMLYGERFTKLFDSGYFRTFYGLKTYGGPLDLFRFFFIFVFYAVLGFVLLGSAYRKNRTPIVRRQVELMIAGSMAPVLIGGITEEILPSIFGIVPFSLLTFAFAIWATCLFIAVVRYRLAQVTPNMAVEAISLTLPAALITTDLAGQITYCNSSSVELFKDGLIEKNLTQFSKDEKVKEVASNLSRGISTEWFEADLKKSDTSVFPADIHCSTIAEKDNKIIGLLWDIRDLTVDLELKQKILGKQKELKEKIVEVEQMNEMMKGREVRFDELVKELNQLRTQFDLPPY